MSYLTYTERQRGFTLMELLLAAGIMAGISAMAVPTISHWLDQYGLRTAILDVRQFLIQARSEAILRGQKIRLSSQQSSDLMSWCLGYRVEQSCDCWQSDVNHDDACMMQAENSKHLFRILSDSYPGIQLSKHFNPEFNPLHGGVRSPGRFTLVKESYSAQIRIALLGRVSLCDEGRYMGEWDACP